MRVRAWACAAAVASVVACCAASSASAASTAPPPASLLLAYDYYQPGQGFQIGLVDPDTAQVFAPPAGVNTTDDELRPALSPDGRYLVFTRMHLSPQLNQDIIPPSSRTLMLADRKTDQVTSQLGGQTIAGAGATFTAGSDPRVAWGLRPPPPPRVGQTQVVGVASLTGGVFSPISSASRSINGNEQGESSQSVFEVPQATMLQGASAADYGFLRVLFDASTGAVTQAKLNLVDDPSASGAATLDRQVDGMQQPSIRASDGLIAASSFPVTNAQIKTLMFPSVAPFQDAGGTFDATRAAGESKTMPTWSPGGLQLAFVRERSGNTQRHVAVYDITPGIQAILNPELDIGTAPTPQLRNFQEVWGGLSLAEEDRSTSVAVTCPTKSCALGLTGASLSTLQLTPTVIGGGSHTIGIIVARVVGKHRVLGQTVPKLKALGRVPLGNAKIARKGRKNHFRWNGKVAGHALKKGTYLLTFRALNKKKRVQAVSRTIRFKVNSKHKIVGVTVLR